MLVQVIENSVAVGYTVSEIYPVKNGTKYMLVIPEPLPASTKIVDVSNIIKITDSTP